MSDKTFHFGKFILQKGLTYVVSDELHSTRSVAENGVKLLIIDGGFLKFINLLT